MLSDLQAKTILTLTVESFLQRKLLQSELNTLNGKFALAKQKGSKAYTALITGDEALFNLGYRLAVTFSKAANPMHPVLTIELFEVGHKADLLTMISKLKLENRPSQSDTTGLAWWSRAANQ